MAVMSIVDDYLFAAMLRSKSTRTEDGMLILTVVEFPGVVACGPDARQAFDDLYRLLEDYVRASLEAGQRLPELNYEHGKIDLNTKEGRSLAHYSETSSVEATDNDRVHIGGPEEFEAFLRDSINDP